MRIPERADCAAGDGVVRRCEHPVHDLVPLAVVHQVRRCRLDLVEGERHLSWHGAVEAGLHVGRPFVLELVRAAGVVLADAGNAGVDGLERKLAELCSCSTVISTKMCIFCSHNTISL